MKIKTLTPSFPCGQMTKTQWPSELPANLSQRFYLSGLLGLQWLAGNSEGHCDNLKKAIVSQSNVNQFQI